MGYEDGYRAGLAGKPKDFVHMVQPKTAAKFALGGNVALDSYIEAYKRGYDKGQEDAHSVKKVEITGNNLKKNTTMEEDDYLEDDYLADGEEELEEECQSIIKGINALIKLYNFLIRECCDRIQGIKLPLSEQVKNLSRTGVPIEACHKLNHEFIPVDWENFDTLYGNIVETDLLLLEKWIQNQQRYYENVSGEVYDPALLTLKEKTECQTSIIRRAENERQSLSLQKSGFQAFIDYLERREEDIVKICTRYASFTNNLDEIGLPEEYHEQYVEECYEENKELFDRIIAHLDRDKEYLEQCRDSL